MGADLHLHTTASDGSLSPSQIVKISSQLGLKAIAITDHDTFAGTNEAIEASAGLPIEIIPGIELSAFTDDKDIHIIAYWPDYQAKWLNDELEDLRLARVERTKKMIDKLNDCNLDVSLYDVLAVAEKASVGRMHVAKALLNKGYIQSIKEAFDKYIGPGGSCYVKKPVRQPDEVLKIITKANGVATLAHPGLADADDMIPSMVESGLAGIEARHPDHNVQQIKFYEEMAHHYNLVVTGGSDFHAKGTGKGALPGTYQVPMESVAELKSRLTKNPKSQIPNPK